MTRLYFLIGVFIVAIALSLYFAREGFTSSTTNNATGQVIAPTIIFSTTTKVSDFMAYNTALLNAANIIKRRLSANPTRVPTLTTQDITTLTSEYLGDSPSTTTFATLLIALERNIEDTSNIQKQITDTIREGKITNNDTILILISKFFPDQIENINVMAESIITTLNTDVARIASQINILNRITQPANPPPNPPANPPANPQPNLNDLLGVIRSPSFNDNKDEKDEKIRIPTPVKPVETPCLDQYYSVLKPQIQKDISTAINNEFTRLTALPNSAPITTPSTQQGCSMQETQQQQQSPDMSKYIRKDSVPCWNCSDL